MSEEHTVWVGAVEYEIVREPELHESQRDGEVCYGKARINLRPGLAPTYERVVLWHELIHAMLTAVGIDGTPEQTIDVIANGIAAALLDNEWLGGDA